MAISISVLAGGLVLGFLVGYAVRKIWAKQQGKAAEEKAVARLKEVEAEAKEIVATAKEKAADFLTEAQREDKEHKSQINALETWLLERDAALDKKVAALAEEEKGVKAKDETLKHRETELVAIR